ncbi:hypothetical protein QZH41_012709, partial [Actinostola sp. cb2023]
CCKVSDDSTYNYLTYQFLLIFVLSRLVLGNRNLYSVVTKSLSPRIKARYVRINPQYWNNWPCMRTELYGCPANEVSPTSPTPIKAFNNHCLVPRSGSCSPADGTKPVFKPGFECKENYMQFSLDANGIFRHHCSGKKVCLENGGTASGTKVVISSTCTDEQAKFTRTAGKSLKHVASGKCVHPSGGQHGDDVELVIWDGCDTERLKLLFMIPGWKQVMETGYGNRLWKQVMETGYGNRLWKQVIETGYGNRLWKQAVETGYGNRLWKQVMEIGYGNRLWQVMETGYGNRLWKQVMETGYRNRLWKQVMETDCVLPLGMQSKTISNSQITASSHRNSEHPYNARLESSSYWCAKEKKQSEYLQIDLGKVQTISAIAIQGRSNWYDWITGFYIYYSQDGQRWTGYSKSGDAQHSNSHCYLGTCQETHDKQCKDLWGPTGGNAVQGCYDKLNVEAKGYGTCDPATNSSCAAADVVCGQIQCKDTLTKPAIKDYGWSYSKISLTSGDQCSTATLKRTDSMGEGMVRTGTKCGTLKMCKDYKCQQFSNLGIQSCTKVNGLECAGRGVCTEKKVCQCSGGYDPATACNTDGTIILLNLTIASRIVASGTAHRNPFFSEEGS